jgi:hypothetical protein
VNRGRPLNEALSAEIDSQVKALTLARAELDALKALAARPGLSIVYDTNMLIHWNRPCDIGWKEVLRASGETATLARLVVPLRVVDELDKQKYGDGKLADRAGKALRYLQEASKDRRPGRPCRSEMGTPPRWRYGSTLRTVAATPTGRSCALPPTWMPYTQPLAKGPHR